MVKFEKHTSVTKEESEVTWKMFIALFFNTALITLIVNASMLFFFWGVFFVFILHSDFSQFNSIHGGDFFC